MQAASSTMVNLAHLDGLVRQYMVVEDIVEVSVRDRRAQAA